MARINTSEIEGYSSMSDAEKLKALESYDFKDQYVSKATFDKTASELAAKKKELDARMTEEEKRQAAAEAAAAELKANYDSAMRELGTIKNKAKLLALGYDESLAEDTAKAMAEGNTEKVFANQQIHLKAVEERIRTEILKNAPAPSGGGVGKVMTKEAFMKLPTEERAKIALTQPETYKAIYGDQGGV
jgi:hypothetical protein